VTNSLPGQPGGGTSGRGGPVPWGTVGRISRENETHFVGNCGVGESRHELIRVAQPCGESVVGWGSRAGNRTTSLSGLSHRFWVTDFGDSVVKMKSPCRYRARVRKSAETRAGARATELLRVRETRLVARATARRVASPGPAHRKATGGELGSRARRFGGRLESSSRRVKRRRDTRLLSGETLRTSSKRDRESEGAARETS
jgi:hypothetical protein